MLSSMPKIDFPSRTVRVLRAKKRKCTRLNTFLPNFCPFLAKISMLTEKMHQMQISVMLNVKISKNKLPAIEFSQVLCLLDLPALHPTGYLFRNEYLSVTLAPKPIMITTTPQGLILLVAESDGRGFSLPVSKPLGIRPTLLSLKQHASCSVSILARKFNILPKMHPFLVKNWQLFSKCCPFF